ncbi:protein TRIGALACTOSYLDIACYLGLYCEROL 5, chloroplastic [Vitis riparia]|uniref:protein TRIGALACTOSYLDIACYLGLYCEROL 5, chloroplastic n=1 Tax=Vitis riparia TaxID=96939 RepID=UPI00155AC899|nr:protein TRIGALACTOSYLDIACYLGLYCEROL 5, chloroplastic [Vitis riparia]
MHGGDDKDGDGEKGLLWKLPVLKSKQVGKLGPGFGFGAGCGIGLGAGFLGGIGFGPGIPGLQLGVGFGAGCGVGLGFGYGVGRGVAHDEYRRYSNVGKLFKGRDLPTQDDIGVLVDEVVRNTKKLIKATEREIEKWRR